MNRAAGSIQVRWGQPRVQTSAGWGGVEQERPWAGVQHQPGAPGADVRPCCALCVPHCSCTNNFLTSTPPSSLPRPAAVTALSLCQLLRELADSRGCTILTTIHQPSSKIFELFHGLILLQVGGRYVLVVRLRFIVCACPAIEQQEHADSQANWVAPRFANPKGQQPELSYSAVCSIPPFFCRRPAALCTRARPPPPLHSSLATVCCAAPAALCLLGFRFNSAGFMPWLLLAQAWLLHLAHAPSLLLQPSLSWSLQASPARR